MIVWLLQVIIHDVDTESGHLNDPGCEVWGNYLTQPTHNNLNVPPTFRYQHQPPRDFPFLIGTKAQTNLDDCSRPLDVSQGGPTQGNTVTGRQD